MVHQIDSKIEHGVSPFTILLKSSGETLKITYNTLVSYFTEIIVHDEIQA